MPKMASRCSTVLPLSTISVVAARSLVVQKPSGGQVLEGLVEAGMVQADAAAIDALLTGQLAADGAAAACAKQAEI